MTKSVLITGATRGLGRGLACEFARRGYRLALTGRSMADLESLAQELPAQADQVVLQTLDVTDFDAVAPVIQDCAGRLGGIDIVVANAGVAIAGKAGAGNFAQMRKTIEVNLAGAIATSEAAIELFRQQGGGQLVGITSVAALRGMPRQSAYSATKAGFSRYLEAVRCETLHEPVQVTELAPGYIDTDINRGMKSRPFLVSAEKGTRIMVDLIERQVNFRYVPPWPWTLVAQALKVLPLSLLRRM
jgi:short-subunit dehydrogenase